MILKHFITVPKLSDTPIRYRLAIAFGILIFFTIVISVLSIFRISKSHDKIEELYSKYFLVIEAERSIEQALQNSHNLLTDAILENDSLRNVDLVKILKNSESEIDSLTNLLSVRYDGNITEIFEIEKNILVLNENRHKIVLHLFKNQIDSANSILKYQENYQIEFLVAKMQHILNTSRKQGEIVYLSNLQERDKVTNLLVFLCVVVVVFGLILSIIITTSITEPIRNIIKNMGNIANEKFDSKLTIYRKDEMGKLADAFRDMQSNLLRWAADMKAEDEYNSWIKTGQAHLYKQVRGDLSVYELGAVVITFLTKYIDAQMGTIYIVYERARHLKHIGSYAIRSKVDVPDYIQFGDGQIGQVAVDKQFRKLENINEKFFASSSAMAELYPREMITIPLVYANKVVAVFEIASYKKIGKREFEFLQSVSETLAIVLNTASVKVRSTKRKKRN